MTKVTPPLSPSLKKRGEIASSRQVGTRNDKGIFLFPNEAREVKVYFHFRASEGTSG